jgi:integrase/recombinase XerD
LWALIAATGCRVSEALSILIEDIDLKSRKINIIPPVERQGLLKKFISESELRMISHKGRTSPATYPIRPFITVFWSALNDYMNSTYKRGANHRFIFQKKTGDPYVNSYRAALASFQKASEGVTGTKYGFHSLRHMYGYYLKNWIPTPDGGFGFPLNDVCAFMGHKDINTTRRYARDDAIKLEAALNYANALQTKGLFTSVSAQKIKMLEQEINRLKSLTGSSSNNHIKAGYDK